MTDASSDRLEASKSVDAFSLDESGSERGAPPDTIMCLRGKVVVLGLQAVGKTSIVSQMTIGQFSKNVQGNVGVSFFTTTVSNASGDVTFDIWDTAGQERFRSINRLYYRNAAVGIVVYNVTDRASFDKLQETWIDPLKELSAPNVLIIIVGNKSDLESERVVSTAEGEAFAKEHGYYFLETSAKTGQNISRLKKLMAQQALVVYKKYPAADGGFQMVRMDRVIISQPEESKSGCCSS